MTPRALAIVAAMAASGAVGVDAYLYDGDPIEPRGLEIAGEMVHIEQRGNVVETDFPWKGEAGLKVKYDLGSTTVVDRILDRSKKEVITETVDFGDGGFKIDILLNMKPDTNVFCYQIEGHENYDFFYQDELTPEEVARGDFRAENIIGSYAVYHKTLKNHLIGGENYATGKVMHIPRPEVWEVNNPTTTKQWAELFYINGELCVEVGQSFLDTAAYPVRVDPTFGYTTAGASWSDIGRVAGNSTVREGHGDTASEDGTVDSMSAYVSSNNGSGGSETADMSIFLNLENTSTDSHSEVLQAEKTNTTFNTGAWETATAGSESISNGTDYVINILADGADLVTNDVDVARDDSGSRTNYFESGGIYSSIESPWTETDITGDNIFSIYATYSVSGGGSSTTPQSIIWFE